MGSTQPHLGVDDIARLLDGSPGDVDRSTVEAHLHVCRECRAVIRDSAVEIGCLDAGGFDFDASAVELVDLGMQVAVSAATNGGGVERLPARKPRPSWTHRVALVAATVAIVVAAGWYGTHVIEGDRSNPVNADVLRPVEAAVGAFSNVGDLVIPGGEAFLGGEMPVYRHTVRAANDDLTASLDILLEKFRADDPSPDAAYWLVAGYLASDNFGKARVYVEWARERFPLDRRLVVLEAIVAFMDGEYERSEELLRRVIDEDANGMLGAVARVDLAVVLREEGRESEAMVILGDVRERYFGTPIAAKAGMISSFAK